MKSASQSSGGPAPGGAVVRRRWLLGLAVAAALWFDPSSGVAKGILWGAGLYALWNWRRTLAAWRNPAGICMVLGTIWAVASVAWSIAPVGTARDLLKSAPMALAAWAVPVVFDRSGRVWAALLASAGMVTLRLTVDMVRLLAELGWPAVMGQARFCHPYLYTHPNVASMMAGLCVFVLAARWLAGAPGAAGKIALAAGLGLDLAYLVMMGSRGPQAVFALMALAFPVACLPDWRVRAAAALAMVAVGTGMWHMADRINPRFRDGTMENFNYRDKVWRHAIKLSNRHPVLGNGFGKKAFVEALYENPDHRAPRLWFRFPHAHSYWLMLYFQGGAVGLALWGLGWLTLGGRLGRSVARARRGAATWGTRLRAPLLPLLLGTGMAFILIYGIADYPDSVIRQALFYLAGLAMVPMPAPAAAAAPR